MMSVIGATAQARGRVPSRAAGPWHSVGRYLGLPVAVRARRVTPEINGYAASGCPLAASRQQASGMFWFTHCRKSPDEDVTTLEFVY